MKNLIKKSIQKITIVSILVAASSCSNFMTNTERTPSSFNQYNSWQVFFQKEIMTKAFISESFSDADYLNPAWRDAGFVALDEKLPKPSSLHMQTIQCAAGNDLLYPAQPYALTKSYHAALYTDYNSNVPAASDACIIQSPNHKFCLSPDGAHVILMSDTYIDACGKMYRGYWAVTFMRTEDNMGTLLGKGRTIINRPGTSINDNDYIPNDTYAIKVSDFLFITELFPGEEANVIKARNSSLVKEFILTPEYTFKRK